MFLFLFCFSSFTASFASLIPSFIPNSDVSLFRCLLSRRMLLLRRFLLLSLDKMTVHHHHPHHRRHHLHPHLSLCLLLFPLLLTCRLFRSLRRQQRWNKYLQIVIIFVLSLLVLPQPLQQIILLYLYCLFPSPHLKKLEAAVHMIPPHLFIPFLFLILSTSFHPLKPLSHLFLLFVLSHRPVLLFLLLPLLSPLSILLRSFPLLFLSLHCLLVSCLLSLLLRPAWLPWRLILCFPPLLLLPVFLLARLCDHLTLSSDPLRLLLWIHLCLPHHLSFFLYRPLILTMLWHLQQNPILLSHPLPLLQVCRLILLPRLPALFPL